ncbi:MAG: 4Fe-4S binding protein [bacterium]|nr:4Fe-4S binding protein [bacterium]
MKTLKKYSSSMIMFAIFETIAVTLWLSLDNIFYLFNFSYIGIFLALGLFLFTRKYKHARLVVQLGVGMYMLVYLGIICQENMQIEGFWYYLFLGVFEAATIHYVVAKIFGPLVFGRGWCGFACWTAMILDLLPFKQPEHDQATGDARRKRYGWIRYVVFSVALLFVGALFVFQVPDKEHIMFVSFLVGNVIYYAVGITLAFVFHDNRAFCKYICPITIFLKLTSRFAWMRVRVNQDQCVSCGKCKKICPMEVDVQDPSRKRHNATECILCMKCIDACPKGALKL